MVTHGVVTHGVVTHGVVTGAVVGIRTKWREAAGGSERQREAVKSIVGSPGIHETPAGMSSDIKAPDPYALSVAPFMAQVLLVT